VKRRKEVSGVAQGAENEYGREVTHVASVEMWGGHTRSRRPQSGEKQPELAGDGGRRHILYNLLDGPRRIGRTSPS